MKHDELVEMYLKMVKAHGLRTVIEYMTGLIHKQDESKPLTTIVNNDKQV